MNRRFSQYLRFKGVSLRSLSGLTCISSSTISRFCNGEAIGSDKLLRLLQACDDLSLEWLFYGTGEMIRRQGQTVYNVGTYAGADMSSGDSVSVNGSSRVSVRQGGVGMEALLAEKDRIITEKDRVIAERDRAISGRDMMIAKLQETISGGGGGGKKPRNMRKPAAQSLRGGLDDREVRKLIKVLILGITKNLFQKAHGLRFSSFLIFAANHAKTSSSSRTVFHLSPLRLRHFPHGEDSALWISTKSA